MSPAKGFMNPVSMIQSAQRRPAMGKSSPCLFDLTVAAMMRALPPGFSPMYMRYGIDTKFEAVVQVTFDDESGAWDGMLIFKDFRFSPRLDTPVHQLTYCTPYAPSGILALIRAEHFWTALCEVFQSLLDTPPVVEREKGSES